MLLIIEKYDPNQPRDENGRWTSVGGSGDMTEDAMNHVDVTDDEMDVSGFEAAGAKWAAKLNLKQKAAVRAYRDQGRFEQINNYMRDGSASRATRDTAEQLRSALDQGTIPDGTVVYRGMSITGKEESASLVDQLKGGTFKDNGFLSASPASSIAGNFVDGGHAGVMFKLTTAGAKGAYIAEKSKEPEFLLQHGASIKIDKVTAYKSGFLYVEARVGH